MMRAMVLAAGLGTRLRPITYAVPKPMVPVLNRPVMEHSVRLLARHGFSEAIATQALCAKAFVPNWCGGMLEAGIGRAHNIAMSTLPNFKLPGDVSASKRYWKEDIIEPEVTVSGKGTIKVPEGAGRGFAIREDLIEKLTVRKETLRA